MAAVPLHAGLARFNRAVTNHVTTPFARHLPGFGLVTHTGRRSGRCYHTPVNAFREPGGWVFALTYGRADWVRNVEAAGSAVLTTRGEDHRIVRPRIVRDPARTAVPAPVRGVLGLIHVDEFLHADDAGHRDADAEVDR